MPEEFSRTTARKRITLGSSFVDVPVITKISFIDASDRYQETQSNIDNSAASDREVHVDIVVHTGDGGVQDTSQSLQVERIDKWKTIDANDRYQETELELDNVTGSDLTPPHFLTHLKTHVVRYKNPSDASVWIDSELIDEFVILDPSDRYQETHYTLNNPQTDDEAQADPADPEISDTANAIDPPWRTDPFQNIININSPSQMVAIWYFSLVRTISSEPGAGDQCSPVVVTTPHNAVILGSWDSLLTLSGPSTPDLPSGFTLTGTPPSISPNTASLPNYQYFNSWCGLPSDVHTDGTATYHLMSEVILGNAPGCYGETGGGFGAHGIGYWVTPPGTAEVASGTIDASGVGISYNGTPWIVKQIFITGGSATYDPFAIYAVYAYFEPP